MATPDDETKATPEHENKATRQQENKENNDKLKDILQQAVEGPSDERKEKLKIKLVLIV